MFLKFIAFNVEVVIFFVNCSLANAAGFFTYGAEVSTAKDDNVTNGARPEDIREDVFYEVGGNISFNQKFANNLHALIYTASVGLKSYAEFDELSSSTLTGSLKYNFAFSRGFSSPVYSVGVSLSDLSTDSLSEE